ncbi:MAG: tetratricopeptide repeat protein [Chlamydiales bacterium]
MSRKILNILLLAIGFPLFAYPPLPSPRTEEEALFVRRIVDFWRDKEYSFAKSHIQAYLQQEENSPFTDHFYAMLGDIAMHDKAYQEALKSYEKIENLALKKEAEVKRWHALYQMEHYMQLYQELASRAPYETEEQQFYFAEAAFREALTLFRYEEGKQQAKSLCQEALIFYASLSNSPSFASIAKLSMAEIYRLLDQPKEAAELYLELAKEGDDEEILFHAAIMLAQCNVSEASHVFLKIVRQGKKRAKEAAFQWLKLLANEGEWEQIDHERNLLLTHLTEAHLPIAYFYLGMIAQEKEQFHQTLADLSKSIEGGLEKPHDKQAILALMISAKELARIDIAEKYFALFEERYPEELAEISFLRAMTYFAAGEKKQALSFLEQITQTFVGEEIIEEASAKKIHLLVDFKNWQEAHTALLSFLESYPHSTRKMEMIRLAIELSLKQLGETKVYAQLIQDIDRAFAVNLFSEEEKEKKRELLVRSYLKLDKLEKAASILNTMDQPDPLLWVEYYIKEGSSSEKIIEYGERALESHPEDRLHLHLFNAYLAQNLVNQDERFTQKAAEHLYHAIDSYSISLENRLWLSRYFAKNDHEKAIPLLETLLQTETNWKRFDEEAIVLAKLYQEQQLWEKAESILEKTIALNLATQSKAKLTLADLYLEKGEKEKALPLYQKLEDSHDLSIAHWAQLHIARLRFAAMPQQSLEKLHDLKTRKTLINEPLYLEAAFDYAILKTTFFPPQERKEKLLEFLLQTKAEFTLQEDIWAKDYHATRELMPEKDLIYQAYMRYLDGWIYLIQSQLTRKKSEREEKKDQAYLLFSSLIEGKYAVSKYLVEKATEGMYSH